MNIPSFQLLNSFVRNHPVAYEAARAFISDDTAARSFAYSQERGGWLLTLSSGEVLFRDYCNRVVGIRLELAGIDTIAMAWTGIEFVKF